jgi:putative nucleotidyltransferase with HDIG domain
VNLSARATSAIKSLPPFPPAAAKVITLLADDSVSLREVAGTLSTDATLSAEVLRLANSPLFSARSEIGSVLQAVSFVGMGRLTGLMLTLSLSRVLKRAKSSPLIRRLWRHNLASGLAAKEFAHSFGLDVNEAYNAGLFHDIGRLAFLAAEPVLYEALVRRGGDVQPLEREQFGADHSEAGAGLLELWKLPKVFAEVARHHHAPAPDGSELIMLVNASCAVANRLGFSVAEVDQIELAADDKLGSSIAETIGILEREYGIG